MNTGWAMTTSMTCSLEVQVFSLHRFLSNSHEIVHLPADCFVFRRELIKDWSDGLAWGKTLRSLWKFPACKWAGKKWREWRFVFLSVKVGHPHVQHQTSVSGLWLQLCKIYLPWFLGFLVWLTDKQPWEQGRKPETSSSQPPSVQVTRWRHHTSSLANSVAAWRAALCHRALGFPCAFTSSLMVKRVFHEGGDRIWTSARKLNPVLLPRRMFQAVT